MTHSNKGWTLVRRGRIEESIEHFREALRLNPNSEWAYEGVVEALKARNPIYHLMLMGSLSMQEMSGHMRTALWWTCWVIPPLRALLIFVLIAGFCTRTIFTFLLRLDPLGRRVLSDKTKRGNNFAMAVVVLLLGGIIFCMINPNALYPESHATAIKARKLFNDGKKEEAMRMWNGIIDRAHRLDDISNPNPGKDIKGSPGHRHALAESSLDDLVDVTSVTSDIDPGFIFKCMMELGHHHFLCAEYLDAERNYGKAADFAHDNSLSKDEAIAQAHKAMAIAAEGQGHYHEQLALKAFAPAIDQLEEESGPHDTAVRALLTEFAVVLEKFNHKDGAKSIRTKLAAMDAAQLGATELGATAPAIVQKQGHHK